MVKKSKITIIFCLYFCFICIPCYGIQLMDNFTVSGFLSQGYMKTDKNNWFGNEEKGSFNFDEYGINFNFSVDKLRLGAQVAARDMGEFGDNELFLDWVHGDYKFKDYLGIRVGKCKVPLGFYNGGRDVDMLRVPVLLPSCVYDESRRDISNSYRGGGIYGNITSFLGEFEYELWYGISEIGSAGMYEKGVIDAMSFNINSFMAVFASAFIENAYDLPQGSVTGMNYNRNSIVNPEDIEVANAATPGISVLWMPFFCEDLKLGVSTQSVDPDVVIPVEFDGDVLIASGLVPGDQIPFNTTGSILFNAKPEYAFVFSGEYFFNEWVFTSEYIMYKLDYNLIYEGFSPFDLSEIEAISKFKISVRGWYVQAVYEISDMFSAGIYYSEFYPDRTDKKGDKLKQRGIEAHRAWQKEIVPTLRIDFNKNLLLKLETHFINGTAQLLTDFNPDGISKNWILYTAKMTFNF